MSNKTLKLLIIEDLEDDVLLITSAVERAGYQVIFKHVDSKETMHEALLQEEWDIIISDFNVPGLNAFDSIEVLRKSFLDLPFIVVSGVVGEETAVNLMKEGAHDFVLKNNLNKLVPVIERALREAEFRKENIRAKKELQESEEFNKAALNSMLSHVTIIDENGFIIAVNSAWTEYAISNGGDLEKLGVGANYFDVCQVSTGSFIEISQNVKEALQKIINGTLNHFSLEYPCDSPDEKRWFLLNAVPFLKQKGKVLIKHIDITEQKLIAESLRKERNFMSTILDTVEALVITVDKQGEIISFNRACEATTGYSFEEVKNKKIFDFLFPKDEKVEVKANFNKIISGCFPYEFENHWVMKDGTKQLFAWNNGAILDENGDVEFVIGTGINITHKKIAENRLLEQSALLDKAQDAIVVRDLNYNIIYWNKSSERLYGWKEEEVLNKNAIKHLYIEDTNVLIQAQENIIEKGEWLGELRQINKFGNEIFVQSRWTLIHDNQGKPKSILTVNTDITEKKKLESQFLRSQRMESIGTLTSGIAHDLNNVLSPIMMAVQILKMELSEAKKQKILATLETSVRRGANIIKQLLIFARGETEHEQVNIKVENLIDEVSNIINETFPKSISLTIDLQNDLWLVNGDGCIPIK